MTEENSIEDREPAACEGRVDPLVGRFGSEQTNEEFLDLKVEIAKANGTLLQMPATHYQIGFDGPVLPFVTSGPRLRQ